MRNFPDGAKSQTNTRGRRTGCVLVLGSAGRAMPRSSRMGGLDGSLCEGGSRLFVALVMDMRAAQDTNWMSKNVNEQYVNEIEGFLLLPWDGWLPLILVAEFEQ